MGSIRHLASLVLLVGCTNDPSPPTSGISSIPSRERRTADITASIGVHDDGTLTQADVYLGDRLDEVFSIELVDGDHLVMTVGESHLVLERAAQVHAWETMVHYVAEVARTDLRQLGIDLRRSDGSVARSMVSIPRAFEITSVPPTVRAGDVVEIGLSPLPDAEVWGSATIQCDGVDHLPSGAFHYAGDGSPPLAGIPTTEVPDGAAWCDANLTITINSDGTYDRALGNPENQTTLGRQQRTTRVRYYP